MRHGESLPAENPSTGLFVSSVNCRRSSSVLEAFVPEGFDIIEDPMLRDVGVGG